MTRLLNTSWPLFRAFRVNVRVSWTIVIIPLFFVWAFAKWMPVGEAFAWGVAWTLALYTTVWTHEMGHIVMGRRCGVETETMTLRALGGLAHLQKEAQSPGDDIRIALAGPATHLAWMAVLFPATWLLRDAHGHETWFWMLDGFARLQIWMIVINLLPFWPTDGGRAMRSAMVFRMHANRASYHTATIGFVGNGAFVVLGLLSLFEIADPLSWGSFGFLQAWWGIYGIQACRQLRLDAKYGAIYGDHDPFAKALLASQSAMRGVDEEEQREREARRAAREERQRLQETTDRLLDRINELGGIDKLSARERSELERASRALSEDG
jgi:Zn-dependent protease